MSEKPLFSRSLPARTGLALAGIALGVGIILRLLLLAGRAPLWQDEAMLAVGVLHGRWSDLFRPLEYLQVAPALYLLCLKAIATLGHSEMLLRLPAWSAGVLALILLYAVVRRECGLPIALTAVILAGCSALLLRYGAEVKPYSMDALFGAAVPYVLLRLEQPGCRKPRRFLALWTGAIVVGSIAAPFLVGGLFLAISVTPAVRKRIGWPALGCLALGAAIGYAALYFGVYESNLRNEPMLNYWLRVS